jgi:TolB protein
MPEHIHRLALIDTRGMLCTCDGDGQQMRVLSTPGRWFQFPAWSPAGAHIAVIGGSRSSAGVWVYDDARDAQPGKGRVLHDQRAHPPIYAYWSPDGTFVSFLAAEPTQETMGMYLAPADGTREAVRVTRGRPCFWAWRPDGRGFLLHSGIAGDDARLNLYVVRDGEARIAQNHIATPGLFQSPGFSRSGSWRAYADLDDEGQLRLIVEDTVGRRTPMAAQLQGSAAIHWSPARDQLAFISADGMRRGFYGPLRLIHADSGEAEVLCERDAVAFFWSPTGRRILYLCLAVGPTSHDDLTGVLDDDERDTGGIWIEGALDAHLLEDGETPEPEPDRLSAWVVDVDTGERTLIDTFTPSPLFAGQFLPFFDQYAHSHRLWSPDGESVVLPIMRDGGDAPPEAWIARYDIPTLTRTLIAEGLCAFWSWT